MKASGLPFSSQSHEGGRGVATLTSRPLSLEPLGCYYPRAPSIWIMPTLGPKVYKHDLLWAIWSPRVKELNSNDHSRDI